MYKGERINSISHLVGACLALGGLVVLAVNAGMTGDFWKITSAIVYGSSLFLLYLASTLYHSFPRGRVKNFFQMFDHVAIYLLIAGTYTPFALVLFRESGGWLMFNLVWGFAAAGIFFKGIAGDRWNMLSTILYLLCGWTIVIDYPRLLELPIPALSLVAAGGALYTIGAVFFLLDRLPRNHEIFHFFVMGASACHYICVLFFVIQGPSGSAIATAF
ncbi:MAG: hemolysin III family protein [Spirochaetales bacterium]|nr:hemolysin III family protein [Leptospiraceae bacterium]MCP5481775.1 hemolysin III family protein [Spirochaetales bacterium]